jgi:hypothetical protein
MNILIVKYGCSGIRSCIAIALLTVTATCAPARRLIVHLDGWSAEGDKVSFQSLAYEFICSAPSCASRHDSPLGKKIRSTITEWTQTAMLGWAFSVSFGQTSLVFCYEYDVGAGPRCEQLTVHTRAWLAATASLQRLTCAVQSLSVHCLKTLVVT